MTDWSHPQVVSDVLMVFPGAIEHLLPAWDEIPDAFWQHDNIWAKLQHRWFMTGLPPETEMHLKPGIEGSAAYRHLTCIQRSYTPKHQHKAAAVAYLASLWFDAVVIGPDEIYGVVPVDPECQDES